jgi:2-oxoglutarate ferredoxin oxidoreductase subunit alpha
MFKAFELADKYRNPVMILGDGLLGQMMEPVEIQNQKSKIQSIEKPWAVTGCKGRERNIAKSFHMNEGDLEKANLILQKKYAGIQKKEQDWEEFFIKDAKIVIVAYGSMARIAKGLVRKLRQEGMRIGLIRPVTLWPFPVKAFANRKPKVSNRKFLVVEMSYGQMVEDVRLSLEGSSKVEFLGRSGGGVLTQAQIFRKIKVLL